MTYGDNSPRRRSRLFGSAVVTALLVLGCSGDADGNRDGSSDGDADGGRAVARDGERAAGAAGADAASADSAGGAGDTLAGRPRDAAPASVRGRTAVSREQALRIARKVVAEPADWGAGFERGSPYKSRTDRGSELNEDCVWEQKPLRSSELATLTLRSELPGGEGEAPSRVAAVVTVHRSVDGAKWEMARTLEEALRCPSQQLSPSERISKLRSVPFPRSDRSTVGHDTVREEGRIRREGAEGSHHYVWAQSRFGRITVGAVTKESEAHTATEIDDALVKAMVVMVYRAELQLGAGR